MKCVSDILLRNWSNHKEILHIPRQLCCLEMNKIYLRSDKCVRRYKQMYFIRIENSIETSLVGRNCGVRYIPISKFLNEQLRFGVVSVWNVGNGRIIQVLLKLVFRGFYTPCLHTLNTTGLLADKQKFIAQPSKTLRKIKQIWNKVNFPEAPKNVEKQEKNRNIILTAIHKEIVKEETARISKGLKD